MKKIFAIALALVMVFSMASAFALSNCATGFDWTCPVENSDCGKAKFEVVPYVKVNNGCGGYDWQVNDCATAINSENVYYALKLTVDAFVNDAWYVLATADVELDDGLAGTEYADVALPAAAELDDDEAQVFYLGLNGQWIAEDDAVITENGNNVVYTATVVDADEAEICATVKSFHNGYNEVWTYGDYDVSVATYTDVTTGDDFGVMEVTKDGSVFTMSWWVDNGKVDEITASSAAFLAEVQAKFNLGGCVVGTCVNNDVILKNFGWDDEFESCFGWSNKGAAVVNPECVVAIPKTGDVSVVAYAVMAVVAAAGAMLKK